MIMGVFIIKEDAEAVDWGTYLANQWAQCETKFSNLNKETNLPKWNGTAVEAVDSDGDGFVEVTTPEQFRWAIQNFKSLKLMNDIDMGGLNGTAWAPVAVGGTVTFEIEGNNHRVYNLYVSGSSQDALFSTVNNPNFIMKNLYNNVNSVDLSSGIQKRDWIYLDDVVSAYEIVLKNKHLFQKGCYYHFEVGTGKTTSLKEFVETLKKITGSSTKLMFGKCEMNRNELMSSCADNKDLLEIGWKPVYDIETGLKKLCEGYLNEKCYRGDTNL